MAHLILPGVGVDDVRFGMTQDEVAAVAGPADDVEHDDYTSRTIELRGTVEHDFDDEGRLEVVTIFRPGRGRAARQRYGDAPYVPALVDGIDVLEKDGFAQLRAQAESVEGDSRAVLFPDLGIVVAGILRRVPEGRYVFAFPPERLEFYRSWIDV